MIKVRWLYTVVGVGYLYIVIPCMNAVVVNTATPRPSAPPPFLVTGFGGGNPQPPRENAPLLPDTPELNAETETEVEVFSLV